MFDQNRCHLRGQTTVEYIVLMSLVVLIALKVAGVMRDAFSGFDGNKGAAELLKEERLEKQFETGRQF